MYSQKGGRGGGCGCGDGTGGGGGRGGHGGGGGGDCGGGEGGGVGAAIPSRQATSSMPLTWLAVPRSNLIHAFSDPAERQGVSAAPSVQAHRTRVSDDAVMYLCDSTTSCARRPAAKTMSYE